MSDDVQENIERFLGFFERKLEEINGAEFGESTRLFRKVLYLGIIDALSKSVTLQKTGNRERIISFLRYFSDWEYQDRISLPHLVRLLTKIPDPQFSELREYAFGLFDHWHSGDVIRLDRDLTIDEARRRWPRNVPKPLEDIQIEHLQHANLFYRHRNSLVHEMREPGYGMEFSENEAPFYHSMGNLNDESYTWELVYPTGFFHQLCVTGIQKLREYYIRDRIDPYDHYKFGSYWIEGLNL
ncbi:hypothetical protein Q7C_1482 [Methylophaga frappieri]|uniref:Uncharacterized protein n=1 Tax=Methylophaga frappieri (strain ATCC BAA-2434 / DSM 25690 / JAM7) TaxID=754477 RepID=I1YI88_METFJ|nr:hypothetical protein [Methylophaga frappieri]AFJ02631.1 hypothetical protein Q7C_1482 [Methylophaga frappieri]